VTIAECPVCGSSFNETKQIPDFAKDPLGWFQMMDADYSGGLSSVELINGLGCMLPIQPEKLTRMIESNWKVWDKDGDGISAVEFSQPLTGLKVFFSSFSSEYKRILNT